MPLFLHSPDTNDIITIRVKSHVLIKRNIMKPMIKILLSILLLPIAMPIKNAAEYYPMSGSESESQPDNALPAVDVDATLYGADDNFLFSGNIIIIEVDKTNTIGDLISKIESDDELIDKMPPGNSLFVTELKIDDIDYANKTDDNLKDAIFDVVQWQDGRWESDIESWDESPLLYRQRKKVKAVVKFEETGEYIKGSDE